MLGLFKKNELETTNKLFQLTVHIRRGSSAEMPENLIGAYVPVFVSAQDHETAAMKAVSSLAQRGFEFIDIADGKIYELDPKKWDSFVKESWPEFDTYFPSQATVLHQLNSEFLFTGPFAGYEAKENA